MVPLEPAVPIPIPQDGSLVCTRTRARDPDRIVILADLLGQPKHDPEFFRHATFGICSNPKFTTDRAP